MMQDQKSSPKDIAKQAQKSKRSSHVSVLVVRLAEKVVDAIKFQLKATGWNALLKVPEGTRVLQVISSPHCSVSAMRPAHFRKQNLQIRRLAVACSGLHGWIYHLW